MKILIHPITGKEHEFTDAAAARLIQAGKKMPVDNWWIEKEEPKKDAGNRADKNDTGKAKK
jgi:hypothetical protein